MANHLVGRVLGARILELGDGRFNIEAVGEVGTANWRDPILRAHVGVVVDGNLDFDFVGDAPDRGEITLPMVSRLTATVNFGGSGTDLGGLHTVRIFAARGWKGFPFPPN